MKARIWASTKLGYVCPKQEAMQISGIASNVCYAEGDFEQILEQPPEKAEERVEGNIEAGHHSVTGHVDYVFGLSGIRAGCQKRKSQKKGKDQRQRGCCSFH